MTLILCSICLYLRYISPSLIRTQRCSTLPLPTLDLIFLFSLPVVRCVSFPALYRHQQLSLSLSIPTLSLFLSLQIYGIVIGCYLICLPSHGFPVILPTYVLPGFSIHTYCIWSIGIVVIHFLRASENSYKHSVMRIGSSTYM